MGGELDRGGYPRVVSRLEAIDLLRGLIMILMALDHVRDFFGVPGVSPTDLARTTVPLFFTRWVTHFCAPVFFLLTGTGASLSLRGRGVGALSRFLVSRGLWLIFLELTLVRCLGFQFNFDYRVTLLNVLWALGWAMLSLAALVWLPTWAITTFGVALIASHNLLDVLGLPLPVLHAPGMLYNGPGHVVFAAYTLIPWIGVTAAGYGLGRVYHWEGERRRSFLLRLGAGLIVGFLLLRAGNLYGDPVPWSGQSGLGLTLVSFLNLTKYPPSLLFLLMTLGPALVVLALVDRRTPRPLAPAVEFGRVPMFYFLVHLPLIHLLAVLLCLVRYGSAHWMFQSPDLGNFPFTPPPEWGVSLPVVYLIWLGVVLSLYPLCRWFGGVKRRRRAWWLGYL